MTCIRKTQCLPCRISLSLLIDQEYTISYATTTSLQIRTDADRRPAARNAPLRRLVPLRVQQSLSVAKRTLRTWREEARIRRTVQVAYRVAQRHETPWLKDAPTHPLQQTLKDLERAYSNFFAKRAEFPRFKKKGRRDSFRYPDPKQIKLDQANSRIFLPKLGWLRYRNSREALGQIKNATVSHRSGKWFVSIQTEREIELATPTGDAIGIDVGIARFVTFSNGRSVQPLNSFRRHEEGLRKAQQAMGRKTKFSNNWKKAKARVQRIHGRIADARNDFLHKLSTR